MADIAGIAELEEVMKRKRVRRAASKYARRVEELKEVPEHILTGCLEEDTILRWPRRTKDKIQQLEVLAEVTESGVDTDGSRIDGQAGAATITKATFLGRYATVMDAEVLAIAMGWELGDKVITDSQAAIGRIQNLQLEPPKGWIEERVVRATTEGGNEIAWVKGHSGVLGHELADLRAKGEAWIERSQKHRHSRRNQTRVQGNVANQAGHE